MTDFREFFIRFGVVDYIDILLVLFLIYIAYRLIRGTAAMKIFLSIVLFYFIYVLTDRLQMKLLSTLLGSIMGVGVLALFIIFQQEIRRFLLHLGSRYTLYARKAKWMQVFFNKKPKSMTLQCLDELTQACRKMAETKTGALIVLARSTSLEFIAETGDLIDATVSRRLIENIFFKNAPLHDGAMLIVSERILAARCTLPISENSDIPAHYGMRHRAAIGISEQTDAMVLVVSEETGSISVIIDGKIQTISSLTELRLSVESAMKW